MIKRARRFWLFLTAVVALFLAFGFSPAGTGASEPPTAPETAPESPPKRSEPKDVECPRNWKPGRSQHNGYRIDGLEFGVGLFTDDRGNRTLDSDRRQSLSFAPKERAVILLHVNVEADNIMFRYQVKWIPADQLGTPFPPPPPTDFAERIGRVLKRGLRSAWYRTPPLPPGCYTLTVFGPGDVLLAAADFTVHPPPPGR